MSEYTHSQPDNTERKWLDQMRRELRPVIAQTALHRLAYLGNGVDLWTKEETAQYTGSFKYRSMYMSVVGAPHGVVLASAGNAAAAAARAGEQLEKPVMVVVPHGTPAVKTENILRQGGNFVKLVTEGNNFDEAQQAARELSDENYQFISPFDSRTAIRANASLGAEIVEQLPTTRRVFTSTGGGSETAATLTAMAHYAPHVKVVAVQLAGNNGVERSLHSGKIEQASSIDKLCEGSAVISPGYECIRAMKRYRHMLEIITVKPADIGAAIEAEYTRRDQLHEIDPSIQFAPFPETTGFMAEAGAQLYKRLHPGIQDERWVAIRSGSNADETKLSEALDAWHNEQIRPSRSGRHNTSTQGSIVAGGHFRG